MKTKIVGEYEAREPLVGDIRPIMSMMTKDPEGFQFELAKRCLFKGGLPVGDAINAIPFSEYVPLISAVMEVSGFAKEGEAGNA